MDEASTDTSLRRIRKASTIYITTRVMSAILRRGTINVPVRMINEIL